MVMVGLISLPHTEWAIFRNNMEVCTYVYYNTLLQIINVVLEILAVFMQVVQLYYNTAHIISFNTHPSGEHSHFIACK